MARAAAGGGTQQGRIGRILHQGMLEEVLGVAAACRGDTDQLGIDQAVERVFQIRLRPLRHRPRSAHARTHGRSPRRSARPSRIGPSRSSRAISEACKVAGIARLGSGLAAKTAPTSIVEIAAFDHRLGQFLDEQRHTVGALDDLLDDLLGQAALPPVMPASSRRRCRGAEAIESRASMTCGCPLQGGLELRAEGDDQQQRQRRRPGR